MNRELRVYDGERVNPLSLQPGGSEVRVLHQDGKNLVYDKIKKPRAYINAVLRDDTVSEVWLDGEKVWPPAKQL